MIILSHAFVIRSSGINYRRFEVFDRAGLGCLWLRHAEFAARYFLNHQCRRFEPQGYLMLQ
jgi:hypothetical protein